MGLETRIWVYSNVYLYLFPYTRHDSDTDSVETDDDETWGGLGKFEYSSKGLPHALVHAPELVERGGHQGAFCTFVNEVGHKNNIKKAAQLSRTLYVQSE